MKRFFSSKWGLALTSALLLLIVCTLALSAVPRTQVHAHPAATQPLLGTAGNFAVLGGSTVTNTGPTVVNGDLGVSPGTAVTNFPPGIVNGAIHAADAVALQAQSDATAAYVNAAGQPCNFNLTGQDLGGKTLIGGVYCFSSSAQLTGQLTLNGQGNPASVFIFQIGSTLTTASNSSVLLINGAQACNIFWQVGSSATIGTTTQFAGNILALTSIAFTTGATSNGSLYARNGAVTLDSNTITRSPCAAATPTPAPTNPTPTTAPTNPTITPAPTNPTPTPAPINPTITPAPINPTPSPVPTNPTPTPALTPAGTATLSPTNASALSLTKKSSGGHLLHVGDKVTYTLTVTNGQTAGLVVAPDTITVADIIPIGEKNLQALGSGWSFTISSTTSPAVITATFAGQLPLSAGASLPPIFITAILTGDAVPSITDTATVDTPGYSGPYSTATATVFVAEQQSNNADNGTNYNGDNDTNEHEDSNNADTDSGGHGNNNGSSSNADTNNGDNDNSTRNTNNGSSHDKKSTTAAHKNGSPGLPFTGGGPIV